jgi:hypothetical protein
LDKTLAYRSIVSMRSRKMLAVPVQASNVMQDALALFGAFCLDFFFLYFIRRLASQILGAAA